METVIKKYIFFLFFMKTLSLSGQFTKFELVFNEPGNDNPRSVVQTPDSGYIISGTTNSYNSFGNMDPFLIKLNAAGEFQWKRNYESSSIENIKSLLILHDGGFLLSGFTNQVNNTYSPFIIRTDSSGIILWDSVYVGNDWEFVHSSILLPDSSVVLAGNTYRVSTGAPDAFAMRIDGMGNVLWKKVYSGNYYDLINDVSYCINGDLLLCGYTTSLGAGGSDIWIIRINNNGDSLWTKTFGEPGDDFGYSIIETSDNNIVVGGSLQSMDSVHQFYAVKTDANGNLIWDEIDNRNEDEAFHTIKETIDGNFAASGFTTNSTGGKEDFYFYMMNPNGNFINARTYGSLETEICYDMIYTLDGGFALLGETFSYGQNFPNLYLIKTDSSGASSGNILYDINEVSDLSNKLKVYPNPAYSKIYLDLDAVSSLENYESVKIYSLSKLVHEIKLSGNEKIIEVSLSGLSPGIYHVSMRTSKNNYTSRLCIQK